MKIKKKSVKILSLFLLCAVILGVFSAWAGNVKVSCSPERREYNELYEQNNGLQEMDIIVTDENYIYTYTSAGDLIIVKADGENSAAVSKTLLYKGNYNFDISATVSDGDEINGKAGNFDFVKEIDYKAKIN